MSQWGQEAVTSGSGSVPLPCEELGPLPQKCGTTFFYNVYFTFVTLEKHLPYF